MPSIVRTLLGIALCLSLGCAAKSRPENVADADLELRMPAAQRFTFGPGDSFRVTVWRHADLTMDLKIAPDGAVTYPLVGRLEMAGKTYDEVAKIMQDAISKYYIDAQVSVNVTEVTNQKVIVMGEVGQPQILQLTNDMSILEALVRTGGINQDSQTNNVMLIRGGGDSPKLYTVDVASIYRQGDMSQMVYLQPGDIVVVPTQTIANVQRYFQRVSSILGPAVSASTIYRNVLYGQSVGN